MNTRDNLSAALAERFGAVYPDGASFDATADIILPQMLPDPSWCDCNHPLYGPTKDRHLPSCRYGIVMDYLDIRDPRAAS